MTATTISFGFDGSAKVRGNVGKPGADRFQSNQSVAADSTPMTPIRQPTQRSQAARVAVDERRAARADQSGAEGDRSDRGDQTAADMNDLNRVEQSDRDPPTARRGRVCEKEWRTEHRREKNRQASDAETEQTEHAPTADRDEPHGRPPSGFKKNMSASLNDLEPCRLERSAHSPSFPRRESSIPLEVCRRRSIGPPPRNALRERVVRPDHNAGRRSPYKTARSSSQTYLHVRGSSSPNVRAQRSASIVGAGTSTGQSKTPRLRKLFKISRAKTL